MSKGKKNENLEDKTLLLMDKMWGLHHTFSRRKIESKRNIDYAFGEVPGIRNMEFPSHLKLNQLLEDSYQALIRTADARTKNLENGFDACQEHAVEFRKKITAARDLYDEINQQQYKHDDSNDELQENGSDPS